MTTLENMEDRKWDGFVQILKTPPAPGEPTVKYRPEGDQIVWSEENQIWEFTGIRLQYEIKPRT